MKKKVFALLMIALVALTSFLPSFAANADAKESIKVTVINQNFEGEHYDLDGYKQGDTIWAPQVTRNGADFSAWHVSYYPGKTDVNGNFIKEEIQMQPGSQFNSYGPVEMIARYQIHINFKLQGGSSHWANPFTFVTGYAFKQYGFPDATKEGYTLKGFYSKAVGGTKISPNLIISEKTPRTLYAQWTPIKDQEDNAWALNATYQVGDKVTYEGKTWTCTFAHSADAPNWYPGAPGIWFWK